MCTVSQLYCVDEEMESEDDGGEVNMTQISFFFT